MEKKILLQPSDMSYGPRRFIELIMRRSTVSSLDVVAFGPKLDIGYGACKVPWSLSENLLRQVKGNIHRVFEWGRATVAQQHRDRIADRGLRHADVAKTSMAEDDAKGRLGIGKKMSV